MMLPQMQGCSAGVWKMTRRRLGVEAAATPTKMTWPTGPTGACSTSVAKCWELCTAGSGCGTYVGSRACAQRMSEAHAELLWGCCKLCAGT